MKLSEKFPFLLSLVLMVVKKQLVDAEEAAQNDSLVSNPLDYTTIGKYMHIAARAGDADYMSRALGVGAAVDLQDDDGYTSLSWACFLVRENVVEVLLKANASVNHQTKSGETPLLLALYNGTGSYLNISILLLENNADPELQNSIGYTALILGASKGFQDIVKRLIEEKADVTHTDTSRYTALMWAARFGYEDVTKILLEAGSLVNHQSDTGDTALMWASLEGHLKIVQQLLDWGADPNIKDDEDYTALMGAAVSGETDIANLLLKEGANLQDKTIAGYNAGTFAIANLDEEMANILLEKAIINEQVSGGNTALHLAVQTNSTLMVKNVLEQCPDINVTNDENKTALEIAEEQELGESFIKMISDYENASCTRFRTKYEVGSSLIQDCEILVCHCTGRWKLTGADPDCGNPMRQLFVKQRMIRLKKNKPSL